MRPLRFALAAACMMATAAFASPTDPRNGAEYITMTAPQPSSTVGKKVEVIEFFMYHCPACNNLEPHLEAWKKRQGDNVIFKRVHFPSTGPNDPEAHLHLTLEAMGKSEEMSAKVFRAFHVERKRLHKDEAILEWIPTQGIDKAKFLEYWNSFGVLTKLKRAPQLVTSYKVEGAPTLVVDGRYMTSPTMAGASNPSMQSQAYAMMPQILDALVAKVQKEKGAAPAAAAKPAK